MSWSVPVSAAGLVAPSPSVDVGVGVAQAAVFLLELLHVGAQVLHQLVVAGHLDAHLLNGLDGLAHLHARVIDFAVHASHGALKEPGQ